MKYYIIAGEASGDMHAANLMHQLDWLDPAAQFRCWGGERMKEVAGNLVQHYKSMNYMGFWEVATNLWSIWTKIRHCKRDIRQYDPDVVILVDFPGFNLRMARYAKKSGYKVFYYISPQVWAWRSSRVKTIKKYVDRMFTILPFEKDFYARWNYEVDYIGHPLLDVVEDYSVPEKFREKNELSDRPIIAVLPGSRKQEITRMLPPMMEVQNRFPNYQFVVAGVETLPREFYQQQVKNTDFQYVYGQTYDLLSHAEVALVTSGTATLEAALFEVPQVVGYRGSFLSYWIGRWVVNVPYISLVNLILDKPLLTELIQKQFTPDTIEQELQRLLTETMHRESMIEGYRSLKKKLGKEGASKRAAQRMYEYLEDETHRKNPKSH